MGEPLMLRFLAAGFAAALVALVVWALVLRVPGGPVTGGQDADPAPQADRALVLPPQPEADLAGFRAAERALQAGDRTAFASLLEGLRADPLYPYLRFAQLDADLAATPDEAIEGFLAEFPATAPTERLRAAYVKRLAAARRWADLVRVYRDDDDSAQRRCLYLRALVETGQADQALAAARLEPLWLVPRPQPAACEPLFAAWRARGGLDTALVWRRIRLAMAAGETALARQLGTRLPSAERPWLERWLAVQARPALVLEAPQGTGQVAGSHPLAAAILADGIGRLARSNPRGAAAVFKSGRASLAADPAALDEAAAALGRALTAAADPQGLALWDLMAARVDNLEAQEHRLRAAIERREWARVAAWVQRMPNLTEKRDRWLYWLARAQSALGDETAAGATFAQAARSRSFWGFLAADRLGLPYHLESRPVPAEPERMRRLNEAPALARIVALRRLGREADMRREWSTLTRGLTPPDLLAAALVAERLGWYDQAIFTLKRADDWDDLQLRFPLGYRDLVEEQAWQTGLPADWVYGVMRQESVFNASVASAAGALGLMQLMPATARQVAAQLGLHVPAPAAILDPELNIKLGANYLAQLRDRFGHAALATAAYNAGPQRVALWQPVRCTAADLWIAVIPYAETRGYVERVLAYRVIYRARLGLEPERLSDLLPPVPARGE